MKTSLGAVLTFFLLLPLASVQTGATESRKHQSNALLQQQGRRITGTVVDETGEPVIGANVKEKGTTNGIVTDADGKFFLNVADNAVLQVSFIGYVTQEINKLPTDGKPLLITLPEDMQALDEVVVIGYGTTQRRNFAGSVSTIKMAESPIAMTPRTNTLDALRGNVTGTTVSRETTAGSSPSIQIHGQKSVNGSSKPLIVLDGMIFMGGWRDIDPNTVESISVLKDASSLAAYGSQAANGVIMITSKKGQRGKPVIRFDGSVSFSDKAMMPELLSPEDFVAKTNYAQGVSDPQAWMAQSEYENYLAGRTTNWDDYVTQTGVMQQYALSVSGATENLNYYMSISHTDQKGILIGDQYKRESLSLRLQNDITDWLQAGAQVNYTYNNYDGLEAETKPFFSPYLQPTRPNGEVERHPFESASTFGDNPLWRTYKAGNIDDRERYATTFLKGHALVKAPWVNGLSYRLNLAYSEENYRHDQFTHEGNWVPDGYYKDDSRYSTETLSRYLSNANGYNNRTLNSYYVWDNILNYTAQFGKHYVDATLVYTRDQYISDSRTQNGTDFSAVGNSILGYNGLAYAAVQKANVSITRKTNIGYLGRVIYNFDDRYHLAASVRRDGSSVFGANKKWGVFPAASVAWTLSRERFMEDISQIGFLKLKTSWGKNGNQSLSPYGTLSRIGLGQAGNRAYVFDNSGVPSWGEFLTAIGNPELGWETTTAFNAGIEIGLFDNRIDFELNVYRSQTTDQIFNRTIPVMTNGFSSTSATMGQVNNRGVEFTLNTVNMREKGFEWQSMLNFTLNRNILAELYGDGRDDISSSLFIGKSLGAIYGLKTIGIVQEDDTEYIAANGATPGFPKFANLDGSADGVITMEGDRTILGYRKENFRMNMSHTFRYKNLELWALFTGVFSGGDYGKEVNWQAFTTRENARNNLDHAYWTPENRSNVYPGVRYSYQNTYTPVMNYGFVRLQDLNLSYTFRQNAVKNMGVRNLRVYLAVKNLFTLTDWIGGDPENQQRFSDNSSYNTHPFYRTYSLGLNLSF
jgi:TonB-linked SusC/RagA family outer membrane protein